MALRALAFSPVAADELWLADDTSDGMVVLDMSNATAPGRLMKDRAQYHYMSNITAMAWNRVSSRSGEFDTFGFLATCQDNS